MTANLEIQLHVSGAAFNPAVVYTPVAFSPQTDDESAMFVIPNRAGILTEVKVGACRLCGGRDCAVEDCAVARRCAVCRTPFARDEVGGRYLCYQHTTLARCADCDGTFDREELRPLALEYQGTWDIIHGWQWDGVAHAGGPLCPACYAAAVAEAQADGLRGADGHRYRIADPALRAARDEAADAAVATLFAALRPLSAEQRAAVRVRVELALDRTVRDAS